MTDALVPTLKSIRQKEFYAQPRFHASIAWALLCNANKNEQSASSSTSQGRSTSSVTPEPLDSLDSETAVGRRTQQEFPAIERLPYDVISKLMDEFGNTLVDREFGTFRIDTVCIRIGKDVSRWRMGNQ